MKYLLLSVVCLSAAFIQPSFSQDATEQFRLSKLLENYYSIKDMLVAGKGDSSSIAAKKFIKNLNGISYKTISEGNVTALLKDAGAIASAKDIAVQRQYFSNLSSNMAVVAKSLKLTSSPIYLQYCPMKKASWLSSDKAIRNPYYGDAMLTCGSIKETIQ